MMWKWALAIRQGFGDLSLRPKRSVQRSILTPKPAGPLSEIYGRVAVLQLANLFYLAFNIACSFAQSSSQMIVCRFFAGLGGR